MWPTLKSHGIAPVDFGCMTVEETRSRESKYITWWLQVALQIFDVYSQLRHLKQGTLGFD